ncbi:hypothetical protein TEA_008058 [Camellia sinensis var. sinensis]|uniref:R13L1/DRL21-like LRR repeat region domain-containing protein n=1 Tax=Camellia sinensis var. sinensis TaxID=542762 RepID=A0A4S4DAU1_CAMSN|nr:hypothetical protein TEA_008058 [Camellia sinensis var. sinensis]
MRDSILKNIVSIELRSCRNCLLLPAFGQLPSLQQLYISKMDYLEYIDNYFPGESPVRGFPALEVLRISKLPNLVGLSREEGRELLPCLHQIDIRNCPKLTLPCLSSPTLLNVSSSSNVVPSSISNLKNLTTLSVHVRDMVSFPEEMLQNLTVLESLSIWGCHEIESLPDHGLRSLKSLKRLTIDHCYKLSYLSESLGHLTALEELNVSGCPKLVTLPDSIKHLPSLAIFNPAFRASSPAKFFGFGDPSNRSSLCMLKTAVLGSFENRNNGASADSSLRTQIQIQLRLQLQLQLRSTSLRSERTGERRKDKRHRNTFFSELVFVVIDWYSSLSLNLL